MVLRVDTWHNASSLLSVLTVYYILLVSIIISSRPSMMIPIVLRITFLALDRVH